MQKPIRPEGIMPAMVTPFTPSGDVDWAAWKASVEYMAKKGVWGMLVCGSTGEAASLTHEERAKIVEAAARANRGAAKIIAGIGAPSTAETVRLAKDAADAGADILLAVTPYYLIPTQDGLLQHYQTLHDAVAIPMMAYNIPQHTGVDIGMELLDKLAAMPRMVGVKESSGRGSYMADAVARVGGKISMIDGGDDTFFAGLVLGAAGSIIALGNIAPDQVVSVYNNVKKGNISAARETYYQILPIARAISVSVNFPAQVKVALNLLGRPAGPCRSPIVALTSQEEAEIRKALVAAHLL
jgi:4-hydroxy-tetrahydrodipicolinate synthase